MFEVVKINTNTKTREVVAPASTKKAGDDLAARFTFTEGDKAVKYTVEPKSR
jgi:hypothetical protein